jgi:hypothetical protein
MEHAPFTLALPSADGPLDKLFAWVKADFYDQLENHAATPQQIARKYGLSRETILTIVVGAPITSATVTALRAYFRKATGDDSAVTPTRRRKLVGVPPGR